MNSNRTTPSVSLRSLPHAKTFNITAPSQRDCLARVQNLLLTYGDRLPNGSILEPLIIALSTPRLSEDTPGEWTIVVTIEI